jgi:hypothetical protein
VLRLVGLQSVSEFRIDRRLALNSKTNIDTMGSYTVREAKPDEQGELTGLVVRATLQAGRVSVMRSVTMISDDG